MIRLQIDHVGVLGPAIDQLVDEYRRLGFTIIGPAELSAVDAHGNRVGLGQHSAHIMFDSSYIELTAVPDASPAHHLTHFLEPPWGMRLLLPACHDIDAVRATCAERGLNPTPVRAATRDLDYNPGKEAKFRWFGLAAEDWPDVLVAYVSHQTPELVFDPDVSRHANGACGLSGLYYVADALPDRYAHLESGGPHSICLIKPDDASGFFGFDVSGTTPFAGIGIATGDLASTLDLIERSGAPYKLIGGACVVQTTTGLCLVFTQDNGQ